MEIIMYTTHCPQCKILAKKLDRKGVSYIEEEDTQKMVELGISTVPMLSVDGGAPMNFKQAVEWINSLEV